MMGFDRFWLNLWVVYSRASPYAAFCDHQMFEILITSKLYIQNLARVQQKPGICAALLYLFDGIAPSKDFHPQVQILKTLIEGRRVA